MFRAIYLVARGCVRIRDAAGKDHFSKQWPIDVGNIQGDVFSPWSFITGLASTLDRADGGRLDLDYDVRRLAGLARSMKRDWSGDWNEANVCNWVSDAWLLLGKTEKPPPASSDEEGSDGELVLEGWISKSYSWQQAWKQTAIAPSTEPATDTLNTDN